MVRKQKHTSGKAGGFTLVEVLTVITVIGILAAIGLPAFLNWLPNMRLRAAAQGLMGDLQRAKVEAIKRNSNVIISFATVVCTPTTVPAPNGSYTIFVDNISVNNLQDAGEPTIAQESMPESVGLCAETFAGATTGFIPQGLLVNNNSGTITLANTRNRSHTMTVSVSGGLTFN